MSKKLLFITDAFDSLNHKKDTSIFMMEESIALNYKVYQCEIHDLYVMDGIVLADSRNIIAIGSNKVESIKKEVIKHALKFIENEL